MAAQTYRGWDVYPGRWPEPNWIGVHPNYDASYEGPEDGWVSNGLSVSADTLDALHDEIDTMIDELED